MSRICRPDPYPGPSAPTSPSQGAVTPVGGARHKSYADIERIALYIPFARHVRAFGVGACSGKVGTGFPKRLSPEKWGSVFRKDRVRKSVDRFSEKIMLRKKRCGISLQEMPREIG